MSRVVIVGASVAGISTADSLRSAGFGGEITVISAESETPYDKPPLSKQALLGAWSEDRLELRSTAFYEQNQITLQLGQRATGLDTARKRLHLTDRSVPYDILVVATGVAARQLNGSKRLEGIHPLRTLADNRRLRTTLVAGLPLVIIGGGFIGLEVAASAAQLGVPVTLVEPQQAPLAAVLGADVGKRIQRLHEMHGVKVITGIGVERTIGDKRLEAVELTDGRRIETQTAVLGIGSSPNTNWLSSSGLRLDDGIHCDEYCRVYGAEAVVAAGDVACRKNPHYNRHIRVEHWTNAIEHADIIAKMLTGKPPGPSYSSLPYFWSDQFDAKLQFVGSSRESESALTINGPGTRRTRSLTLFSHRQRAIGALAWNWPTAVGRVKRLLATRAAPRAIAEHLSKEASK